jgi:hypothetical protein
VENFVLVELGLFLGDRLLEKGSIRITAKEVIDKSEVVSLRHRLVDDVAEIELSVFDCGVQKVKSNLEMPVHESEDWESIELAEYTLAFKCRLNA